REALCNGFVLRVPVVDSEARERLEKGSLRVSQRDAVLRPPWPGERRLDAREVELDDLRVGRSIVRLVPECILLAVGLDERDPFLRASREAQVAERLVVDGEEAACRP